MRKLKLEKIKIASLSNNEMHSVYGGTLGGNGCGENTKKLGNVCPVTDTKKPNCP